MMRTNLTREDMLRWMEVAAQQCHPDVLAEEILRFVSDARERIMEEASEMPDEAVPG